MISPSRRPTPASDSRLIAEVAAGNQDAQREFIEKLTPRVRRVTRLLIGNAADADDAAQAVLLELLAAAKALRDPHSLERWADRIAVRVSLRFAKRERRRNGLLRRWLVPGELPWGQELLQSQLQEGSDVFVLLSRLAPRQREAFVLRHVLEYTIPEIAELTATPPGTIKNRLLKSREVLATLVREKTAKRGGRQ